MRLTKSDQVLKRKTKAFLTVRKVKNFKDDALVETDFSKQAPPVGF